ncbi:MAG: helix-turn-helix domain-containing protein, partial [Candidatus Roizmanbacteria bacterium]|nr:helix-turn-helix domain-containing protein [Candidatus Roizmanbacteria bacterium]
DIAFALGWKEPSRLSRIEQGRIEKPKRELIESLAKAMRLKEEEKNSLLLAGSYIPNQQETDKAIAFVRKQMQTWEYPGSMFDFTWKIFYSNNNMFIMYQITPEERKYIDEACPNLLDVHFNILYPKIQRDSPNEILPTKEYLTYILFRFRVQQQRRTREKWYIDLVQKLMDNELFREIWQKTERMDEQLLGGDYSLRKVPNKQTPQGFLTHHFFATQLIFDPRFYTGWFVPADIETFSHYQTQKK